MKEKDLMQISQLSEVTGVPASTIRFYLRERLLPQPIKTGKTKAYYQQSHVKAIELIKSEQAKGNKTLQSIRREVERKLIPKGFNEVVPAPVNHRNKIISSATNLFSKHGYAETSISDIAKHARLSRETFYMHFRSKEELFIECANLVFRDMYRDVWHQLREEKDIIKRSAKRGAAFYSSYPKWIKMMNIVRGLAVGNPAIKEKFKTLLKQMIAPISEEHRILKQAGVNKKSSDSNICGYFIMGMAEQGASLISRGQSTEKEVDKYLNEINLHGL